MKLRFTSFSVLELIAFPVHLFLNLPRSHVRNTAECNILFLTIVMKEVSSANKHIYMYAVYIHTI
jgi:hypothetical protein